MSGANGRAKVILYARVSTREQAESGFSLRQQLERLREYAAAQGYEVLEAVEDAGYSGAKLQRPGLDRVRDLVAAGGVSLVLAQDRDRFAREPAYLYILKQEFAAHGCKLKALNDRGDDSPEGELTDGILDQLSKFERAKTAERSRRGKLQKARQGKLVGGHHAAYGFRFNAARDGYEVDEDTMPVVRRIFRMVGVERQSINAVRRALEAEGIPSPPSRVRPQGGRTWRRGTIRTLVLDDKYRPHTHAEIAQIVAPAVAARLDPRQRHGLCSYNGVAVPVPGSGIPREWVDAAREAIRENRRTSSAGHRIWQLSGVLCCEHCGLRMVPNALMKRPTAPGFYYRCPTRQHQGKEACRHATHHRAERLEESVWQEVLRIISNPDRLLRQYEEHVECKKRQMRGDPDREVRDLAERLRKLDYRRSGYLDLAADGDMSREELRTKLADLDEQRDGLQKALREAHSRQQALRDPEINYAYLKSVLHQLQPHLNGINLTIASAEDRRRLYQALRLHVELDEHGAITLSGIFDPDVYLPDVLLDPPDLPKVVTSNSRPSPTASP